MLDRVTARLHDVARRLRRLERRELAEFRRWIEQTDNLIHLTVLLVVPLLIAFVTGLTNATDLSFLLFPPLASGTYTLFADPEGKYASPRKFVVGLTVGALCGWAAQEVAVLLYGPVEAMIIHPSSAALSIFLVGAATWVLDVEEPSAFSTALLVLVTDGSRSVTLLDLTLSQHTAYVVGVAVSGSLIAGAFAVWRGRFYERRAQYLYGTASGDDHVLVPMRGETAERTALFGARLAAAHEAGKVVLLAVLDAGDLEAGDESRLAAEEGAPTDLAADEGSPTDLAAEEGAPTDLAAEEGSATAAAVDRLDRVASTVRTRVGVPCEVVVATGDPGQTTIDTARDANCDLVVTPYEEDRGSLSSYVKTVFRGPVDAIAFRSTTGKERWKRVLVAVSRPGDSAHAMIDFACRLSGRAGGVSVCTCIDRESERRPAENRLANIVETADSPVETRVARADVTDFIEANAGAYDLVVLGSSGDRSAASRFVSPPTFERLREVDCDVAVVDRGRAY